LGGTSSFFDEERSLYNYEGIRSSSSEDTTTEVERQACEVRMPEQTITRQQIIQHIRPILERVEFIRAVWLGGSDATDRTDQWSDIDLYLVADDARVEETFIELHTTLESLSPIETSYRLPSPTWHGHEQEFLSLLNADPFAQLDIVVMAKSKPDRFLERERHGTALILFDKDGLAVPPPLDLQLHWSKLRKRLVTLRAQFEFGQSAVRRAILRGFGAEAMSCYQNLSLRPVVELLRMRYCPERFDYGIRYIDRDLPPELRKKIEQLAFPPTCQAIERYRVEAEALYRVNIEELDRGVWSVD
jgi:hypothetical protein